MNTNDLTTSEQCLALQEDTRTQDPVDAASKLLTPTLLSLDITQKNALDISNLVGYVEDLSGHEQYVQANDAIMSDPSLSIQEKLRLKRENDEWQDHRTAKGTEVVADLQETNTKNTSEATYSWVAPALLVLSIGAGAFFGFTPTGRRIAGAALKAAQSITV